MAATRKQRPRNSPETLTAEFTSGQLVVGICVSLFVALVVFLTGVLVGRYQAPAKAEAGEAQPQVAENAPAPPGEKGGISREAETTVASPRQQTPRNDAAEGRYTARSERSGPRTRELPAPAPDRQQGPIRVSRNPDLRQSAPAPAPAANTTPRPAQSEAPPPLGTRQEVIEKEIPPPVEEKPAEAPAPKPAPKPAPAPVKPEEKPAPANPATPPAPAPAPTAQSSDLGKYGVQLAAFRDADREKRADEYLRLLEKNTDLTAQILISPDKQIYRIVVVGYKDRQAAERMRDELKKKAAFRDAYVRTLQ